MNKFAIVLQVVSTGLIGKIMTDTELNEDAAMESLYSSALYSVLEKEETKVWHYSVPMLYDLYKEETATGKFTFPVH
jgi:hypothetical protein